MKRTLKNRSGQYVDISAYCVVSTGLKMRLDQTDGIAVLVCIPGSYLEQKC
jgi:hypothetical protein